MAVKNELTYFDLKHPRGEMVRLTLAIGGISFVDNRIAFSDFSALAKTGKLPFRSLPVMTIDGETVSQCYALARYWGKHAGLYPEGDAELALKIDEFLGGVEDVISSLNASKGPEQRAEWVKTTAPRYLGGLEAIAAKNKASATWVCGPNMTIADVTIYTVIGIIRDGFYSDVSDAIFEDHPRLLASSKAVHAHPKVVEWNKTHPWKNF